MKGLDTNVMVRYLVQDDSVQGERASRFIQKTVTAGESLFLNDIVLCELVWVLESAYGYSKRDIIGALEKILSTSQFEIEDKNAAWSALDDYKNSQADYSDCLIGRKNILSDCDRTATFDRSLRGLNGFELI